MASTTPTLRSTRILARLSRRSLHTTAPTSHPRRPSTWAHASHLDPAPSLPAPLPAIYAQRIVLSNGASFVAHTTAPAPAVLRMTRDVENNTLWNPRKEGRREEGEGGRVERFRARFGGSGSSGPAVEAREATSEDKNQQEAGAPAGAGFSASDLDWMSEGATEYKPSAKEMQGGGQAKKGGKRK